MARISGYQGAWEVFLDVTETGTSIESNTSSAYWQLGIRRTDGGRYPIYGTPNVYISVSGNTVYNGALQVSQSSVGSGDVILTAGNLYNIYHNSDGTIGSNAISFSWSGSGFSPSSVSASGSYPTATIPRTTVCPQLSGFVGSTYNLSLDKKSSSFTSALYITFGNKRGWLQANGTIGNDRYNFSTNTPTITIPTSFYEEFSTPSAKGKMTLYTRSGNIDIGSSEATLTVNCNTALCMPNINGVAYDVNPKTLELTEDNKIIISSMSNVKIDFNIVNISAIEDNRATVSSIILNSSISIPTSDRTVTIVGATSIKYTLQVTNSRGATSIINIETGGEIIPYVPLSIRPTFFRPQPTTGEVTTEFSGNYWSGRFREKSVSTKWNTNTIGNTFDNVLLDTVLYGEPPQILENELKLSYQYKKQYDTEWSEEHEISTYTIDTTNFTYEGIEALINYDDLENNFDYRESYEFRIHYQDLLIDGYTESFLISRGLPIFWWSKEDFYINGDLYVKDKLVENIKRHDDEEHIIGYWTNNKPIYERTIKATLPSSQGTWVTIYTNATNNVDELIDMRGNFKEGTAQFVVPMGEGQYYINMRLNGNNIMCIRNGWSAMTVNITIQYTKTTD